MSVKAPQFCEPFFSIKEIQDEDEYLIDNNSIVISLSEEEDIMVKDKPVSYLKSTIVKTLRYIICKRQL